MNLRVSNRGYDTHAAEYSVTVTWKKDNKDGGQLTYAKCNEVDEVRGFHKA